MKIIQSYSYIHPIVMLHRKNIFSLGLIFSSLPSPQMCFFFAFLKNKER